MLKKRSKISQKELLARMLESVAVGDTTDIDKWRDDPVGLFEQLGMKFPPKIFHYFLDLCNDRIPAVVGLGPRGGGKSQALSAAGTFLFIVRNFDVFSVGGSLAQAQNLYSYATRYMTGHPDLENLLEDEPLKTAATMPAGNWFKVAAASNKSVRGPHPGDPHPGTHFEPHGGCLLFDEVAEIDERIYSAAVSTVNAARPSLIRAGSTNHVFGSVMSKIITNPRDWGYAKFHKWDCFDVSEKCRSSCKNCYVEFAGRKHTSYREWCRARGAPHKGPESPRGYCEGRAKKGEGWIRVADIKLAFKLLGRETFEIEWMCYEPAGAGLLCPSAYMDRCLTGTVKFIEPMPGQMTKFWIDPAPGFTAMGVTQLYKDQKAAVLDCAHLIGQQSDENIVSTAVGMIRRLNASSGAGDATSNPWILSRISKEAGINLEFRYFNQHKEIGAGAMRQLAEQGLWMIPGRKLAPGRYEFPSPAFELMYEQIIGWRRDENGKIVKKKDHYPDGILCVATDFLPGMNDFSSRFHPKKEKFPMKYAQNRPTTGPGQSGAYR